MSVDIVILSLSRYLSGAYIPPSFKKAWSAGDEAELHHIDGSVRRFAKNTPIGGEKADESFALWRKNITAYKASLPYKIGTQNWDEKAPFSDDESWSVDHLLFGRLTDAARKALEKPPSIFKRMIGHYSTASHLVNARVFVDVVFEKPFQKGEILFGSLPVLENELLSFKAPVETQPIVSLLQRAIALSRKRHLPLIIDV